MKLMTAPANSMGCWTVYRHPLDYPGHYVARLFLIDRGGPEPLPTTEMFTAATLDEVRALLPPGLTCLARASSDDPMIVETWI